MLAAVEQGGRKAIRCAAQCVSYSGVVTLLFGFVNTI